jgi:heparosan-N-sulfate-glucuronate 5-epimerase
LIELLGIGRSAARTLAERGPLPLGPSLHPSEVRGYCIDFRAKTEVPIWPPPWFPWPGFHRYMAISQWGLGAFERYLLGEGERWLAAARSAAEYLLEQQVRDGTLQGGWPEPNAYAHTFRTRPDWLSAMAQGQCSSLLVRVGVELEDTRLLEAAALGLRPMLVASTAGGVRAELAGGPFLEEYPTEPPSFVLNGAIFAAWGAFDVWRGAGDASAGRLFNDVLETLVANLRRWDTGFWSRYDLYPHPLVNVASPSYHRLHIAQLQALSLVSPAPPLSATANRFERYGGSASCRARALAHKVAFRLAVRKRRVRR